jgi:hypothetical protein
MTMAAQGLHAIMTLCGVAQWLASPAPGPGSISPGTPLSDGVLDYNNQSRRSTQLRKSETHAGDGGFYEE